MDTNEKTKDLNDVIAYLAETFPKCFTLGKEAKPLKVGIFKDITERMDESSEISRTQLRQALRRYTSSWKYLAAIQKGGFRVDLDGNNCDELEQEHIEHAKKTLEESKARFAEKKKNSKQTPSKNFKPKRDGDKKTYKKPRTEAGNGKAKQANVKHTDRKSHKPEVIKKRPSARKFDMTPLSTENVVVGVNVKVKLGKSPVPGVITDVGKEDIHVQLNGGVIIKTARENLFVA